MVTYGCECWTLKKAECQKNYAFKLWCWRRLLKIPWTAKKSNQSILREINPEYLLEGLMIKLKLQYFDRLTWTADSLEKSLMLGKIEGKRRRGRQRMEWLDDITNAMNMNLGKLREMERNREAWQTAVHGVAKSWKQLGDWTTIRDIVCVLVAYLCPTLCDPIDCSPPGSSSLHGILQVFSKNTGVSCVSFSRGSSRPRDWNQVSFIAGRFFTI